MAEGRMDIHACRQGIAPELSIPDLLVHNKAKTDTTDATTRDIDHSKNSTSRSNAQCPRDPSNAQKPQIQRSKAVQHRDISPQQAVLNQDRNEKSWVRTRTHHVPEHFEATYRLSIPPPAQLLQVAIPKFANYDVSGPPAQFQIPVTQAAVGQQLVRRKPGPNRARPRRANNSTTKKSTPRSPDAPAPALPTATSSQKPSSRTFALSGGVSLNASAGPPVFSEVRGQDVEQLSGPGITGRKRLRPTYEEIYGAVSSKRMCRLDLDKRARW
ncbi:hypothetical protein PsYK624_054060 [Phanerochaete sordida]|uniref:Uncharacterized protein n=1 Tax=Phanerochaete sordida TaxID=48140 RepID=A0A9P3G7L7_9APHY|nr:hypothetical protein PsYK624_054060 [Phanerochaete sordida]